MKTVPNDKQLGYYVAFNVAYGHHILFNKKVYYVIGTNSEVFENRTSTQLLIVRNVATQKYEVIPVTLQNRVKEVTILK